MNIRQSPYGRYLQSFINKEGLAHFHRPFIRADGRYIMGYYLHHFQEISRRTEYGQIPFPRPWPSKKVLETLVEWTRADPFAYAMTLVKFLQLGPRHPTLQLRMAVDRFSSLASGKTSFMYPLDALYDTILTANSDHADHKQTRDVLAAILLFSQDSIDPTPANIELVLGLPEGQVALTLRGMHSVLDIRGREDNIRLFDVQFREYLLNQSRSHHFHIDVPAQRQAIERRWLHNLSPVSG